jgi:hypothetical protein
MDFSCMLAAKYEIRPLREVMLTNGIYTEPLNMPQLVQVGRAEPVRPNLKALDYAIGLLLQQRMPKWRAEQTKRAALVGRINLKSRAKIMAAYQEDVQLDEDEFSKLKRSVLAIAAKIGMISRRASRDSKVPQTESLLHWIHLANHVQNIFGWGKFQVGNTKVIPVGNLGIYIAIGSKKPDSVLIRPDKTRDAIIYRAAQMFTGGTKLQSCSNCSAPFLAGGVGRDGKKKRADARFCSNTCRITYHNKIRAKAR